MRFPFGVLSVVLVVGSFITMMHVKNGVQDMRQESRMLLGERKQLVESLKVLEAEEAYLTRPERLEAYAFAAGLQEIEPRQVLNFPQIKAVSYKEVR